MMGDGVKNILTKPIQLADQVTKLTDDAHFFRAECQELKAKTERLSTLLRQAARSALYERPVRAAELYERPVWRIMADTEQVLDKAVAWVFKCRAKGLMKRMFAIIPAGSFRKVSAALDNSIGDVSWLLSISAAGAEDGEMHLGLPPIAQNEPILFLIWEQIATLHAGSLDARAEAAASLVSLARDNERYGKLIIEESGIGPLLRLVKEGRLEGQVNAARAIGLLGCNPESVELIMLAGACSVFAKVLKQSPMKVQAVVAWAVSELAASHPKCQDAFGQDNVVRLLAGHLAFETVQEHSKYSIPSKATSVVLADNSLVPSDSSVGSLEHPAVRHPIDGQAALNQMHGVIQSTLAVNAGPHRHLSPKERELEDPSAKANMKAMAARALGQLARGNPTICRSITESKALLCFTVLLEKGVAEVQYYSAMALMEIARVAEEDADLRRSAFKRTSPTALAVVDQLLRVVEKSEHGDLLVPCITALGCMSKTFRATETRIIGPLVRLLDGREGVVRREAAIALTKFACTSNHLHLNHSKAIINAGGAKLLVQLVYFGEQGVQIAALILVSYIALNVPESEALSRADVLALLEWTMKQSYMMQVPEIEALLPEAKSRLELFQSIGSKGYQ